MLDSPTASPSPPAPLGTAPLTDEAPSSALEAAVFLCAALFLLIVVRMGWASDDAFIAIRSVDHLVHGLGFTINVGERVQSFTSPLWALVCLPFLLLTKSPYAALVFPGVLASVALTLVIRRSHRASPAMAAVVCLTLAASTSFTIFSTSGLENALLHLLAALFVWDRWQRGGPATRRTYLIAAGLFLARFDAVLLVLPALGWSLFRDRKNALKSMAPGAALVVAWLAFATFYYGFPWPNTAYAKLNTAIPLGQRLGQGLAYLAETASRDPVVVLAFASAAWVGLRRSTPPAVRFLLAGVGLYLAYVLVIGGDFMSGRFFTTCYLVCVLTAVPCLGSLHRAALPVTALVFALVLATGLADRRAERTQGDCMVLHTGIVDERECYVVDTGLMSNLRGEKWRTHGYLRDFENATKGQGPVVVFDLVGLAGYANREEKHVVERFALTEPVLARIQLAPGGGWRVGHFFREIPAGYLETLQSGTNVIRDPCVHRLYDRLDPVIHGPLFTWKRLSALVSLTFHRSTCPSPS